VSEPGARSLAGRATRRTARYSLRSRRIYASPPTGALALQNKDLIYGLLFRCSAQTLLEIAADPKHLGAEIGFFSVLHTWNQKLQHHPHVHCVVAAGGLSPDHTHWVRGRHDHFFLPEGVLSEVF